MMIDYGKVTFMKNMIPTPTMSEILWEEFMEPMGISAYRLAKDICQGRVQFDPFGRLKVTQ